MEKFIILSCNQLKFEFLTCLTYAQTFSIRLKSQIKKLGELLQVLSSNFDADRKSKTTATEETAFSQKPFLTLF